MLKNTRTNETYVSILADGLMHVKVAEGTPGAVKRDYKTSDGVAGVKHELVYSELSGKITKIGFYDGEYGKSIQLTIIDDSSDDAKPVVLSVNCASNFGEDIMKKLPNIDLNEYIKLVPYSFEDEKTKKLKKGVTIYQNFGDSPKDKGDKIENFFWDTKKEKVCNGYPEPKFKKKVVSKDEWKAYFLNARIFLIDYITENFKTDSAVAEDKDFDEIADEAFDGKKK